MVHPIIFLTLCLVLQALTSALPLRGHPSHPHLRPLIRATCSLTPFPFGDSLPGCNSFKDILSGGTAALIDELANPFGSTTLADEDVQNINSKLLQPVADSLNDIVDSVLNSNQAPAFLDSNICLGNFAGSFAFDEYEGACANLPLKGNDKWTVFGFALEIGPSSPFKALCPGVDSDGTFASFCVAVTKDCQDKPSIVLSLTPDLFKCQPFDAILAASTAGASEIIVGGLGAVVDSYTFGLSTTNSFEVDFTTFDGNNIIEFSTPGSIYSAGTFSLSTDTIPNVPEFFKFSGEAIKMINVDGVEEAVKKTVDEFRKTPKDPEAALKSLKTVASQLSFSILYNIKLNMQFAFSELGKLGNALPDSEEFEIGDASIYATTSAVSSGSDSLKPGLYMYTSAAPSAIIKALLKYGLTFVGEILNAIPDWVPIDIDASSLADKIKTGGNSDDFAVSFVTIVPDLKAVFMIRAPLVVKELGFIELKCSIDVDAEDFKCQVKSDFGTKIFAAIGEALEDSVMWVAKELEDFGDDFVDAGEKVLAAGLSTLGDAADAVGSVFSKDTIDDTLAALGRNSVVLDKLGDVGYQISAWGIETGDKINDVLGDIGDGVETGVKKLGEFSEDVIDEAEEFFKVSSADLDKFSGALADSLGCSTPNVKKAIDGVCKSCCSKAYNLRSTLKEANGSIEKAVEDVIQIVGEFFEKTFNDILSSIGLSKTSTSISKKSINKFDSVSNCRIYEYWEKRKTTTGVWPFRFTKTTNHHLYDAPDESCVKAALEKTEQAMSANDAFKKAAADLAVTKTKMAAGTTALGMTKEKLMASGMKCSSVMKTVEGKVVALTTKKPVVVRSFPPVIKWVTTTSKVYSVPLVITCSAPKILSNGKLSSTMYTTAVTKSLAVEKSSQSSALSGFNSAEEEAKKKLIDMITENVPTSG